MTSYPHAPEGSGESRAPSTPGRAASDAPAAGIPATPGESRNRLLRALRPEDFAWLAARLEPVDLPVRRQLAGPDEPFSHVYFPESGVVSMVNPIADGGAVEVGTVGPEGLVGLGAYLDAGANPSDCFVQVSGRGYRVTAEDFCAGAEGRPGMRRVVNRYTQAFLTQVAQTASCNRAHDLAERCARWLLMTHDRVHRDHFLLTHEFLGMMLGVRRAGVTVAAGMLQRAGVIRYSRGKITVVDRAALEAASCECYSVVRAHFDRLLGGNTPAA